MDGTKPPHRILERRLIIFSISRMIYENTEYRVHGWKIYLMGGMGIFSEYPDISEQIQRLCKTRYHEILQAMVESDGAHGALRRVRAEASARLRAALADKDALDAYIDAVLAQESYELEAVYRQGFIDALELLKGRGLS